MENNKKLAIWIAIGIILGLSSFKLLGVGVGKAISNNYIYGDCIENKRMIDEGHCAKTFADCGCNYFGTKSCGSRFGENSLVLSCIEFEVVDKLSESVTAINGLYKMIKSEEEA